MLKRTNTTQILISQDATIRGIAADALSQLPEGQVTVRDMPVFEDLYSDATTNSAFTDVNVKLPETHNPDALAIILHSSGRLIYAEDIFIRRAEQYRVPRRLHGTPEADSLDAQASGTLRKRTSYVSFGSFTRLGADVVL